jgi:phage gpG-like protein
MNINYKIDQKDLRLLKKKIKSLKDYSGQTLSNEIGKTGFAIERRSKRKVPVDTGGLKQSIKTFHSGKKAFVEAGKKYAPFVEFGTGSKVDLTDMKALGIPESYAKQFKGKGIRDINLPARPFLFPSARTEFLNLLKRITDKLKKLT